MNLARQQNIRLLYRNLLLFFIITMKHQKVQKPIPLKLHLKNKITRNKPNQGGERLIENYKTLIKETEGDATNKIAHVLQL